MNLRKLCSRSRAGSDARELEVHAVGAGREVAAPVQAAGVGERDELADAAGFAAKCGRGAEPVPGLVEVDGGTVRVRRERLAGAADEARRERASELQDGVTQPSFCNLGKEPLEHGSGDAVQADGPTLREERELRDGHAHDVLFYPTAEDANGLRILFRGCGFVLECAQQLLALLRVERWETWWGGPVRSVLVGGRIHEARVEAERLCTREGPRADHAVGDQAMRPLKGLGERNGTRTIDTVYLQV